MNIGNLMQSRIIVIAGLVATLFVPGCGGTKYLKNSQNQLSAPEKITLQEGDTIKIIFPDASNLNATVKIRRDGTVTLPEIGEIHVAGTTATELEKVLLGKYADKIVSKEINVSIESSIFQIYVTGAVMHPGKVMSDRPLTALEAILEAGGVDYSRANLKEVVVTRKNNGTTEHYKVNVQGMISGQSNETFNLRPNDILFVREKFSWF